MKMSDAFGAVIIALIGCAVGFAIGVTYTNMDWRVDCERLGAHVSTAGSVYDCKKRPIDGGKG